MRHFQNHFITFAVAVLATAAASSYARAEEAGTTNSYVTVPIRVNLDFVEEQINAEVPDRLADINQNNAVCIPAKKAYYEYPCFKGWKWYTCDGWTYISPEVKCDVSGWVKRNGRIKITGQDKSLRISFPVSAKISASAAGLSETASAKATIFADLTPVISRDWGLSVAVKPDFAWDQRPTLELFGFIKMTIGSKVEPKLREKLKEFAGKVPSLLAELKIRENVEEAWMKLQDPVKVSDEPLTHLVFKPNSVGFSDITINSNILNVQIVLAGDTSIVIGPVSKSKKVPLPQLQGVSLEEGIFRFKWPISIHYSEIIKTVESRFPNGYTTKIEDRNFPGILTIKNPSIGRKGDGKLRIAVDVSYDNRSRWLKFIDIFDWFDVSGKVEFAAVPAIDESNHVLYVRELEFDSDTNSGLVDTLVEIAKLPLIRNYLSGLVRYEYGDEINDALQRINKAMKIELAKGVKLFGAMTAVTVSDLRIEEKHFSVFTGMEGNVRVDVGLENGVRVTP